LVSNEVVIKNQTGLHARPAAAVIKLSKTFKSSISIKSGERKCDAKHLFQLLHCNFKIGETIIIEAEGEDEAEALQQLVTLINNLEE
jgi:phosphocarrier protein